VTKRLKLQLFFFAEKYFKASTFRVISLTAKFNGDSLAVGLKLGCNGSRLCSDISQIQGKVKIRSQLITNRI